MKRIFALVGLLTISSLWSGQLPAEECLASVGKFVPTGPIRSIAVEGTTGAAYDFQKDEILLLDLTDPSRPVERARIASIGTADLAIDRQVLYVVNGSGTLWLYNVADPRNPSFMGSYTDSGALDRVDASGGIAIALDLTGPNSVTFDVSNPSAIRRLGQLRLPKGTADAALVGTKMYLIMNTDEIRIYSLAQLDRITLASSVKFPGSTFSRLDADGQLLLALDSTKRLATLLDATGVPAVVATTPLKTVFAVSLSGCTAQLLASNSIEAFDISTCANGLCNSADNGLSLVSGRFSVRADWADSTGRTGIAHAVRLTDNSGYFWFFDRTNAEVQVKMLDACVEPFNRFWFFGAGLTNVEVKLEVSDLKTGRVFRYTNPQGTPFAPIQDTSGIDVCP